MKLKKEIADLEKRATDGAVDFTPVAYNTPRARFTTLLREILSENLGLGAASSLEYYEESADYTVTFKDTMRPLPGVVGDFTVVFTIDPKKPLGPQIESIQTKRAALEKAYGSLYFLGGDRTPEEKRAARVERLIEALDMVKDLPTD